MATFDTNLMTVPSTTTLGTAHSVGGGLAIFTGNWLTLGTKVAGPVPMRVSIQTCASNTDTLSIAFEMSDDQSTINETYVRTVTGTELGAANLAWATMTPPDIHVKVNPRRRYIRARGTARGLGVAYGTIAIGVDAEDMNPYR